MYLDFIIDILHQGDSITIHCDNDVYTGVILKMTKDMIAIRLSTGNIIIKRDEEITNIDTNVIDKTATEYRNDIAPIKQTVVGKTKGSNLLQHYETIGDEIENNNINHLHLHALANKIETSLSRTEGDVMIFANAYVIETLKHTIVVNTKDNPKYRVLTKTIVTSKLLSEINNFRIGDVLPLVLYSHKDNPSKVILTVSPGTILSFVKILKTSVEERHYLQTKLLCYFLLSHIRNKSTRVSIFEVLKELKLITLFTANVRLERPSGAKTCKTPKPYKEIEKEINNLIRNGQHKEAIESIDKALSSNILNDKYKSSLLLKKAQTFSSITDYESAKKTYIDLISFNESIHGDAKNLSHLYTELARLQAMNKDENDLAVGSVKKALQYNRDNSFASTLLSQLNNGKTNTNSNIDSASDDSELMLESDEGSVTISKMIDIDIKEHKFTNEDILRNDSKPNAIIAKNIFDTAKATKEVDLSERYPVYLEAAKAFSELPIGSYDYQDYLEAVAYYAILKGDSIYIKFRNAVSQGENDIKYLTRLKDSACSYYIESLNLMSSIPSNRLLSILSNYLKISIALCNIKNNEPVNFTGQFQSVFFSCIDSDNVEYNDIAWSVIIAVGAASAGAWNKLVRIKGGTSGLYGKMSGNPQTIYNTINRLGATNISTNLKPGDFLKSVFKKRITLNKELATYCGEMIKLNVDVHLITRISDAWRKIREYDFLMSTTDNESKNAVEDFLRILTPYANRNQAERTTLLIQVQRLLEKQIAFINDNTTYYGRTFFFSLFNKWKKSIQGLLDKKIADTLPILQVLADPPYIVMNGEKKIVNLIVKNIGDSTADGCILAPRVSEVNSSKSIKAVNEYKREIPAGTNFEFSMNLPKHLYDANSIELSMEITALYQGKEVGTQEYSFTLENEPESSLTYNDIPWKDGAIPKEQMFKGRKQILDVLKRHYTSLEKDKPYILYGLTRTGKSSILKYLKEALNNQNTTFDGHQFTIATFDWDLSLASSFGNAQDLWQYLLFDQVYDHIGDYLDGSVYQEFNLSERPRAKDFPSILFYLKKKGIYPLFLVDEFSFIKVLMDNRIVNPAFLHTLRQYALEGLASFIYAGTYDIKALIKDQKYGITGQLVNAVEEQISEISPSAAEELITVMGERLRFTNEARSHIHTLSGDVPYFIQIICKYCGLFAVEKKRSIIGYPELEYVIKILTGEHEYEQGSMVMPLPENVFQNNMFSPADPKEVNVLITSLAYFNRENIENQRGVGMVELQELWAKKNIQAFRSKLAEAIELLLEKKVILQYEDDGLPVYKLSVDLFRRWWGQHHNDLTREIDTIL